MAAATKVAQIMAKELGKTDEWAQNEVNQYIELAKRYTL
jgi:glycerol-3-phosphate dehydrogenase